MAAAAQGALAKEKELTRQRDRLSAERRDIPWVNIERTCVFATPDGRRTHQGKVPLEDVSGFSVFIEGGEGDVYHIYSTFGRGAEEVKLEMPSTAD